MNYLSVFPALSLLLLLPGAPSPPLLASPTPSCSLWPLSLLWRMKQSRHGPNALSTGERVDEKFI